MRYYFAPMEGLTDRVYRRLHHQFFPGLDRYYTPFFSPTVHRALTSREAKELPQADTWGVETVPQLLTKVPADFLWMASVCRDLGYQEVNLNLGCPSGTVTAKGKGAGLLRDPEELDRFLEDIYSHAPLPISIKTRLGFTQPEEFISILEILNRYPVKELTIHPRVRSAFYNGAVDLGMFRYATEHAKAPLCFNGNLCSKADIQQFSQAFPGISAVMIGRGLIGDPGMLTPGGTDRKTLAEFLDALLAEYAAEFGGTRNAMFRLKENWRYLFCLFTPDSKLQKQLRKTVDVAQYKAITHRILTELPMNDRLMSDW